MTLPPDSKSAIAFAVGVALIEQLVYTGHTADIQGMVLGYSALCAAVLWHDIADTKAQAAAAPPATPP